MRESIKKYSMLAVAGLICFGAGRFLGPSKVEIKEVEKIIVKETGEKKVTEHIVETKKLDGTTVKETKKITESKKNKNTESDTTLVKTVTNRPNYQVTILATIATATQPTVYSAMVSRRLFSEIYVGAFVNDQQQFGISVTVGF